MSASTTTTTTAGNADRYGGVIATKLDTAFDPNQVPDLVKSLRSTFNSDKTLSKAWRVSQLNAMLRMIEESRKELRRGMREDLHKSDIEGDLTELDLVISEIHGALESLDEWMAPVSTNSSALNVPCASEIKPDPLGLILIMGAWNYPMQLTLAPMVGAIAAGNCIIIKPGSYAVSSSHILVNLISKYMDQSCIRCIEGNREVTEALLKEKFDKICFTGSTYVGKLIAMEAAKTLTPVLLELGGKSPTIVDKTADLDHAVKRIIWGSFMNSGQTCVRPDFGLIHEDVADEFFKRANEAVKQFYGSDPQKTEFFGRIINDTACKRLSKLQEECKNKIVVGNGRNDLSDKFVEPTVFDFGSDLDAFAKSPLMQDEIFGPLYPCARFREVDQAVKFIRNLPTGKPLALYCFSKDSNFIQQITDRTTSGGLCVNDCLMHLANHELPFGGVGNSGMGGGYHGRRSFIQFSHEKAVLTKYQTIDQLPFVKPLLELRFPPYDTQLKKVILPIFGNHHVGRLVTLDYPWLRKAIVVYLAYIALRAVGFKITRE